MKMVNDIISHLKEYGKLKSLSGVFVAYEHFGDVLIGIDNNYNYYPIAKILDNLVIKGITGNSGDRYERLSPIEKVDIATLITKIHNIY